MMDAKVSEWRSGWTDWQARKNKETIQIAL